MQVTADDQKMLNDIISVLEQCYMKEVAIKKQFSVTIACEKLGQFKKKLDAHLQELAKAAAVTSPLQAMVEPQKVTPITSGKKRK